MPRREARARRQRQTLLVIFGIVALMLVTLLLLLIGAIATSVSSNDHKDPVGTNAPVDKAVEWADVTFTDANAKALGSLVLSNQTHAFAIADNDESLESIYSYRREQHKESAPYQLGGTEFMNVEALVALDSMLSAFSNATGKTNAMIRLAYVTAEEKETTWGGTLSKHASALDYKTGLGCDLFYTDDDGNVSITAEGADTTYAWIVNNAHKYGFVMRYPDAKSESTGVTGYTNYFRYVGVAHATYMKANDLCLEEYIDYLKANTSHSKTLEIAGADGKTYEVYYAAINGNTTVPCPTNFNYTVSGTNNGGVVITVDRSTAKTTEPTTTGTTASALE